MDHHLRRGRRFFGEKGTLAFESREASKGFKSLDDRAGARYFVGPEQVGLTQGGKHREKGFGTTHFLAEVLERMGQGMTDGKTETP